MGLDIEIRITTMEGYHASKFRMQVRRPGKEVVTLEHLLPNELVFGEWNHLFDVMKRTLKEAITQKEDEDRQRAKSRETLDEEVHHLLKGNR